MFGVIDWELKQWKNTSDGHKLLKIMLSRGRMEEELFLLFLCGLCILITKLLLYYMAMGVFVVILDNDSE